MTMTITLSENMAQKLTQYLAAFRKADAEFARAIDAGSFPDREEAVRERNQAARRLACVLDCVVQESPKP